MWQNTSETFVKAAAAHPAAERHRAGTEVGYDAGQRQEQAAPAEAHEASEPPYHAERVDPDAGQGAECC